jgi:hypothetical protein
MTMKKIVYILTFLFLAINSFGQDKIENLTRPIVDEGKRLYKSEMASWYGTDIFIEQFKDREKIGGYFSYSDNEIAKCIFFSKGDNPKVIGTISFDSAYHVQTAKTDLSEREFTKSEFDLFTIRSIALKTINSDTLFKTYKNTSLNLIPLISNGEKKVYVLTGPQNNGVVIFGNDYLLTFNNENKLTNRKQLHRNIIVTNYGEKTEGGNEIVGAMHTHLPETGDFITSTDICTLMLYEKFAKWKQYNIISAHYFSIWNCETDNLTTITQEVMDKIDKDQKKRHKKE